MLRLHLNQAEKAADKAEAEVADLQQKLAGMKEAAKKIGGLSPFLDIVLPRCVCVTCVAWIGRGGWHEAPGCAEGSKRGCRCCF
jgi:hypothetical protein